MEAVPREGGGTERGKTLYAVLQMTKAMYELKEQAALEDIDSDADTDIATDATDYDTAAKDIANLDDIEGIEAVNDDDAVNDDVSDPTS